MPPSKRVVKRPANRRLSDRERKLLEFLSEHPEATLEEAGRFAGYPEKNTAQRVYDNLQRAALREEMAKAMEEDDELSNAALRFKLKQGLKAKQKVRSFDRNGNPVAEFDDDDFVTRRSYLQLIGKWKGLEMERHEVSGPDGGAIPTESIDALKTLTKEELLKLIKATE